MPHCYSCPSSVAWASNASIVLAVALTVVFIGNVHLEHHFAQTLPVTHIKTYECMRRTRTFYLVLGLTFGSGVVLFWKPYTRYTRR